MFCPKCGNNCGDNRFCGRCGTQISLEKTQEPQKPVWSVGMACPHCGGTKLEGNNCAFCGAQLVTAVVNSPYLDIPLGKYDGGCCGWLLLSEEFFETYWTNIFKQEYKQIIPYTQIERIQLVRAHKNKLGFLSVRWVGNKDLPFPTSRKGYFGDPTTITFSIEYNEDFYKVFCFLKAKAPPSAEFRMYQSV